MVIWEFLKGIFSEAAWETCRDWSGLAYERQSFLWVIESAIKAPAKWDGSIFMFVFVALNYIACMYQAMNDR